MWDSNRGLTRREYLRQLVAVGGTAALAACLDEKGESDGKGISKGNPAQRPQRQHAWNAVLDCDEDSNVIPPEHRVLLALDLETEPTTGESETVQAAFRSLESAYAYDPEGLLFTVGYTPSYFETIGRDAPIPSPRVLTSIENPWFDSFDAMVHLASDSPDVVLETEEALFGEISEPNGVEMSTPETILIQRESPALSVSDGCSDTSRNRGTNRGMARLRRGGGHHYRAVLEGVELGDELTITVDTLPQIARHSGYETAFLDMPDVTVTV